ncbi:MAG: cytochrome c [Anaerolineaceae bacterium]|nr:cytochrome c [Anaerolineaceae bacterium]
MKKTFWSLLVVAILSALVLTACGGGGGASITRVDPPADYASKTSPAADAAAGQTIYTQNCTSCHGDAGLGDGPAGAALDPVPGNLQTAAKEASDAYLFWIISEGGAAASRSASMAAYKGVLSEADIWNVIAYIKTLK